MEPFSIATGIVGVLAAIDQAQKCVRKIRTLHNAHAEIVQLAEDVSDLQESLQHMSKLVSDGYDVTNMSMDAKVSDSPVLSLDKLQTVERLGSKAAVKLKQLTGLIPESSAVNPVGHNKVGQGRFAKLWIKEENLQWSRNRAQAQQLQRELCGIQLNILINLSVISATADLHASSHSANTIIYNDDRRIILKSGATPPSANPDSSVYSLIASELEAGLHPNETDPPYGIVEAIQDSSMTRKIPPLEANMHATGSQSELKLVKPAESAIKSKFSCMDWCSCRCHKRTTLRLSDLPRGLYGSLFISSNGLIFGLTTCDEQQCQRSGRRAFKLIYRLPAWLSDRQIQLSYLSDPLYGPELNVCLPLSRGWFEPIWKKAVQGDTLGIRQMFDNGDASPYDVNPLGGSLLHYAADRCYWDLCKLLIERGATPFIVDGLGGNPTYKAWEHYLSGLLDEDAKMFIRKSFDGAEYLESRQFTIIHKVTLGLTRLNLESLLQSSTSDIDAQDAEGKTCLTWAAIRGDEATMVTLLRFGANPNICDFRQLTPLHHVLSGSCCEILLQYGANTDCREEHGRTALHWACRLPVRHHSVVAALLKAGIDPNIRDNFGETALMNASWGGYEERVLELLRGPQDPTNDGLDLVKCFADATHLGHYGVVRCLWNNCDRFSKFSHVLPKGGNKPWVESDFDPALLKYFENERTCLYSLSRSHNTVDDHLRQRELDFAEMFGENSNGLGVPFNGAADKIEEDKD